MKKRLLLIICLLFTGCASTPVSDWLSTSYNQLENYKKSYLSGKDNVAAVQFKAAINEISKSGDLEILSRAYLIRMALQATALEDMNEDEYLKMDALQPSLTNRSFYALLKGEINKVDQEMLPRQYRDFYKSLRKAQDAESLQEAKKIEDPLSQLIALAVIMRLHQGNEDVLNTALAIASVQGWKKPLMAYLARLQSYYESNKQADKAAKIQQRVELLRPIK
jgi:hypothetical protein